MWKQNSFTKTVIGLSAITVLVVSWSSQRISADGSNGEARNLHPKPTNCSGTCQRCNAPEAPSVKAAPNYQQATQQLPPSIPLRAPHATSGAAGITRAPAVSFPPARYVRTTNAPQLPTVPPSALPSIPTRGLPSGVWTNETPMGDATMTTSGNKICISFKGKGEFLPFQPSLRGEYSVASDGTIFGLFHSADLGPVAASAEDLGETYMLLSGLSDIPFSMRTYSDSDVLAVKQVTFGLPMQALIATDGEFSELLLYAQSVLTGQYQRSR